MAYMGRPGATAPLTTADIPTNSISTAHLINDSVTSAKIGVDVIVAEDLASNSVTVAEIADDAVTGAKLANDIAITTTGALTGTTGDFNWDSNTLVVDSSASKVGVGTATPAVNLDFGTPGDATLKQLIGLRTNSNSRIGIGTANSGMAIGFYVPSDVTASEGFVWGTIASGDGTTFAEKMRLTREGKLGINTAAPAGDFTVGGVFTVNGDNNAQYGMRYENSGDDFYNGWSITENSSKTRTAATFYDYNGNSTEASMSFKVGSYNHATTTYIAGVNAITPQMTILANGNVGIATSSPNNKLCVAGRITPKDDNTHYVGESDHRWTAFYATNGTVQTSDSRMKTDVAESNLGLGFINKLKPISYKWIQGGREVIQEETDEKPAILKDIQGKRTHYGLLSQDVKEALGDQDFGGHQIEDHLKNPEGRQSLNYSQFIAPIIKAVQELSAKVTALENA